MTHESNSQNTEMKFQKMLLLKYEKQGPKKKTLHFILMECSNIWEAEYRQLEKDEQDTQLKSWD